MKKKQLLSLALSLIMAFTVFSIPVSGYAAEEGAVPEPDASAAEEDVVTVGSVTADENDDAAEEAESTAAPEGEIQTFGVASKEAILGEEFIDYVEVGDAMVYVLNTTGRDSYYEIKARNIDFSGKLFVGLWDESGYLWYDYVYVGYSTTVPYLIDGKKLEKNKAYEIRFIPSDENASSGSSGGNFVLTTREIKDNCGDDFAHAKTISTGTVNGAIEIAQDQDWMKFTAPSTDKYRVKLTNKNTQNAIRYARFDSSSNQQGSAVSAAGSKTSTKDYYLKKGQVVYFQICGNPAKYVLSIQKLKRTNPMVVKALKKKVKVTKVKKKAQTVKAISVSKAKGKVTYKKVSGSKKLTVNKKTGKITVKKKTKKGTYTIKVKVTAAGTKDYKAKSKTVKVTVKVYKPPKTVTMTAYDKCIKDGNTVYCIAQGTDGGGGIYKVDLTKGTKKRIVKRDSDDLNLLFGMKLHDGYLYYYYGIWGGFGVERIKTSGKDRKELVEINTDEENEDYGYAIKGNKLYCSWQSESGKNHRKQMNLNGKSKKNVSVIAKNKYKDSNAKGYNIIWKEGTSTSKIYLKTPKKKIFLLKVNE